jgi:hypothetical protein
MVNRGVRMLPETIADLLDPEREIRGEKRMLRVL